MILKLTLDGAGTKRPLGDVGRRMRACAKEMRPSAHGWWVRLGRAGGDTGAVKLDALARA